MGGGFVVMQSATTHKWEVLTSYYLGKFSDMWFIEEFFLIHLRTVDLYLVKVTCIQYV